MAMQPQQRRLDQPFAMLVECFNKYYADITSRKKVAVAPTSSADRKHTKALDSAPKALLAQDESICVICSHLPARNGRVPMPTRSRTAPSQANWRHTSNYSAT
jgi:hypothetical protein